MSTHAWPDPPVTLNTLSASWRVALTAAQDAVHAGASCLTPEDIRILSAHLNEERIEVERLLEADARMEHVRLVRRLSPPTTGRAQLGLPAGVDACLFDLDGVLTPTADLHFAAWAEVLDRFLARRFERASVHFSQYARLSRLSDYAESIHGKPRADGVRAFLASRGITLPEGASDDPPDAETVNGLANAKNAALRARLAREGVSALAGSSRYLESVADAGLACAVVSASANTASFLERAALADLVDVVVDGNVMTSHDLNAKPAPDTLLVACARLGITPERAVSFETTAAGVAAARSAHLSFVVAVAEAEPLPADRQVGDLAELLQPARRDR